MSSLQLIFSEWQHNNQRSKSSISSTSLNSRFLLEGLTCLLTHLSSQGDLWIFVGFSNGAIWKWTIPLQVLKNDEGLGLEELPVDLIMIGHRNSIRAMAITQTRTDFPLNPKRHQQQKGGHRKYFTETLVSVDEVGEMAVWNCQDGRCLLHNLKAMGSDRLAGYPNSLSISPDGQFCIVGGFVDKLVILRLSTLEIVQIVEVSSDRQPRWIRSANFLHLSREDGRIEIKSDEDRDFQHEDGIDDENRNSDSSPMTLLDFLTLNFNASIAESVTARQFDPQTGLFVSPACPILPEELIRFISKRKTTNKNIPINNEPVSPMKSKSMSAPGSASSSGTASLSDSASGSASMSSSALSLSSMSVPVASFKLLKSSPFNPTLAVLLSEPRDIWLVDFLTGKWAHLSTEFDLNLMTEECFGVEFLPTQGGDLLMIWSAGNAQNRGDKPKNIAFYQIPNSLLQQRTKKDAQESSGILIIRRLDLVFDTMVAAKGNEVGASPQIQDSQIPSPIVGNLRTAIQHITCLSDQELLVMSKQETEVGGLVSSTISLFQVDFDPFSREQTVHLRRKSSEITLCDIKSEKLEKPMNSSAKITEELEGPVNSSNVTAIALLEPHWIIQGHSNGQLGIRHLLDVMRTEREWIISEIPPESQPQGTASPAPKSSDPAASHQPSKSLSSPITAICAQKSSDTTGTVILAAGDEAGRMQFWELQLNQDHGHVVRFRGRSQFHWRPVVGIASKLHSDGLLYFFPWTGDGTLALCSLISGRYRTVHVFKAPTDQDDVNKALAGLYWKSSGDLDGGLHGQLLLSYTSTTASTPTLSTSNTSSSGTATTSTLWDLNGGRRVSPDLSDSAFLEFVGSSDWKVQLSSNSSANGSSGTQLMAGIVRIPDKQRQSQQKVLLSFDIRLLMTRLVEKEETETTGESSTIQQLAKAILSQLLEWGASERLDQLAGEVLGMNLKKNSLVLGLSGANGNINLLMKHQSSHNALAGSFSKWTCSSNLTATLQLIIIALFESIPWNHHFDQQQQFEVVDEAVASFLTFYTAQIGDYVERQCPDTEATSFPVSSNFCPAALSFLVKYWQDSSNWEIQYACRLILSSSLSRMSSPQKEDAIAYWKDYLPASTSNASTGTSPPTATADPPATATVIPTSTMNRAVIILAIIEVQEPESLDGIACRRVADSLVNLLLEDRRNLFRLAAIELLGRGYGKSWQSYIHGASILKLLVSWLAQLTNQVGDTLITTHETKPSQRRSRRRSSLNAVPCDAGNRVFYQITLQTILHLLTESGGKGPASAPALNIRPPGRSLIHSWLTDCLNSASQPQALPILQVFLTILTEILKFRPFALMGCEHLILELLMKGYLQDSALRGVFSGEASKLLNDLKDIFGTIATGGSLVACPVGDSAVGACVIIVHDLKTGQKVSLLQGHSHPCSFLAFKPSTTSTSAASKTLDPAAPTSSPSLLFSYSWREATIKWWNLSGGSGAGGSGPSAFSSLISSLVNSSGQESVVFDDPSSSLSQAATRPGLKPIRTLIVKPELTNALAQLPEGSLLRANPIQVTWKLDAGIAELRVVGQLMQTLEIPK